jgi:hypothetical protein
VVNLRIELKGREREEKKKLNFDKEKLALLDLKKLKKLVIYLYFL